MSSNSELDDAMNIKSHLASGMYDNINIECFNVTEAEKIASYLTDEELIKVGFQVKYKDKEPSKIKLTKFV